MLANSRFLTRMPKFWLSFIVSSFIFCGCYYILLKMHKHTLTYQSLFVDGPYLDSMEGRKNSDSVPPTDAKRTTYQYATDFNVCKWDFQNGGLLRLFFGLDALYLES